jgi:hypothetical protein
MSRIAGCLEKLKSEGRKALIPYFRQVTRTQD